MDCLENRLKKARKHANLTQPQLADLIGVSRRTMVNYEKDASKATVPIVQKIASECKVDEIWLLTGKGTMLGDTDYNITKLVIEHQGLIKRFKNPKRAKEINERLIDIEDASDELYDKADTYLQGLHDAAKVINDSKKTPKSGKDDIPGRKPA